MEYFEIKEMPGEKFFLCEKRMATIRICVCVKMWTLASSKDADERYLSCRGCRIGAGHAGCEEATISPLFGKSVCGRCGVGTTRLVGAHLCVSCVNRQYEWIKGRNARGNKPTAHPGLWRLSVRYQTGGRTKVRALPYALDRLELVTAVLRDEPKQSTFGFSCAARPALPQMELFS